MCGNPGRRYYIMVDGNAGAVCDYSIRAGTGVSVPSVGLDQTVCNTAAVLSASPAAGSWSVLAGAGVFANPNAHLGLSSVYVLGRYPCRLAAAAGRVLAGCRPRLRRVCALRAHPIAP